MFIHDDTQTASFATTSYTEPSTVTVNYVAGLKPNTGYTVKRSAGNTQVNVTAGGTTTTDNAGVLKF